MNPAEKKYKKAVILGAAGFIGINLAHALVNAGLDVVCFDRVLSAQWPKNVKFVAGNFSESTPELLVELEQAYIFHLVSSCRPSSDTAQAANDVARDLISTIDYLERTKERDVRWIFISSGGTVYGQKDIDSIVESSSTEPICSYGLLKLSIENYFSLYQKVHGVDFVTIRLGNPYGRWQDPKKGQGIVAALIYKALTHQTIEIWGDGSNVRDYIYIDDAINGIISAAFSGDQGEVFNVGTGIGTSIVELVEKISCSLKLDISVQHTASRAVDVRRNVLNSNKLSSQTNWTISTDLATGILQTAAWMRVSLPGQI